MTSTSNSKARILISGPFRQRDAASSLEKLRAMSPEHFLRWLAMADLRATGDTGLRAVLESVLDEALEESGELTDRLFDEIEDQLDADRLDHGTILDWPNRYSGLLPSQIGPSRPGQANANVPETGPSTPLMVRFHDCLEKLSEAKDKGATALAWAELEKLELEVAIAQAEHEAQPAQASSADTVSGHQLLQQGFEKWREAFDLAKVGEAGPALVAAHEGNRLFRAVAEWSDDVTGGK